MTLTLGMGPARGDESSAASWRFSTFPGEFLHLLGRLLARASRKYHRCEVWLGSLPRTPSRGAAAVALRGTVLVSSFRLRLLLTC